MSSAAPEPQGHGQHHWDVGCIRLTALPRVEHFYPSQNGLSLKRHLWHLKGESPTWAARQRLLLHVGGFPGPQGHGQHRWDVSSIRPTALARVAHSLPSKIGRFAETVALAPDGRVT